MSELIELNAEIRDNLGKGASRRSRRLEDKTPAVVYGGDEAPEHISIAHNHVLKALENEAVYSSILTLDVAGKKQKVVLKDLQRHAYKPKVMHMDFQRISAKEKINMSVPLHFINEDTAPGVKQGGGIISHLETSIDVSCLPADLPEFIEVDLGHLELDAAIHLSELNIPKSIELVDLQHDNDKAVASIHLPRAAKEADEAAPEANADSDADANSDDNNA